VISEAVENYLKAIYEIQSGAGRVTTNALAERLGVSPASVTGMLKKLAEDRPRLVDYERHRGVSLTAAGKRIAEMLGHPEFDPHGDPIPAKDGTVRELVTPALSALDAGQSGRVARVSDADPALLRYLGELGIILDATLTVAERGPFGGPLHVRVGAAGTPAHALGREVTDHVFIELEAQPGAPD
jgi:DtxR family Mn-dependent transcriptional regulator